MRKPPDVSVSFDPRVKVEFCTRASDGAGFLGTGFLGTGFLGTGFLGTGFLGSLMLAIIVPSIRFCGSQSTTSNA
jgi:hypothetical protein